MKEHELQFHLEEYRSLKMEVEYRVKATERIEYLIIVAIGAVYVWLSQQSTSPWMWWLPVALPILGFLRQFSLLTRILHVSKYILSVEDILCHKQLQGWEHFLRDIRRSPKGRIISMSGYVLWILLIIFTFWIALNGGFPKSNADVLPFS